MWGAIFACLPPAALVAIRGTSTANLRRVDALVARLLGAGELRFAHDPARAVPFLRPELALHAWAAGTLERPSGASPMTEVFADVMLRDVNDATLRTSAATGAHSIELIRELDLVTSAVGADESRSMHMSFQVVVSALRGSGRVVIIKTGTPPPEGYTDAQVVDLLRVGLVTIRPPTEAWTDELRRLADTLSRVRRTLATEPPYSPAWDTASAYLEELEATAVELGVDPDTLGSGRAP